MPLDPSDGGRPPCPFAVVAPTPFYTPGGCSARVLGEVDGVSKSHRPPTVFSYGTGAEVRGVPVTRSGPRIRGLTTGFHWSRPGLDLLLMRTVLARRDLPPSLHVHLYEGGLIGEAIHRLRGIPYVVDLQGSLVEEAGRYVKGLRAGWVASWLSRFERLAEGGASCVVTSSPSMARYVKEHAPQLSNRVVCIDDGVPESSILTPENREDCRTAARASLNDPAGDFVVAYVGSLSPSQGIDDLLAAAPSIVRHVPRARFRLYGTPNPGSTLAGYRAMADRAGVGPYVEFLDAIPYAEATRVLAGADVAVTWKTNRFEGNGKVALYMGAGVPTVAIRSPVVERYLGPEGKKGGIVADTVGAASDAVVQLARDPELRRQLGDAALVTARKELTWTARGEELLRLHDRIVAHSEAGRA